MSDIQAFVPEFVANQVLTDRQLNDLRNYLEDQELLTRIRLAGMGIVCGLDCIFETTKISVSGGFGVTSDGYIIELPGTDYTHVRSYKDPDVKEDKATPQYERWQNPASGQIDILELLHVNDNAVPLKNAAPLTAGTANDRILVLYLEREKVDLNSCLMTDCDRKGLNVNLNVRVLLVPKRVFTAVPGCPQPPELVRLPRLHTKVPLTEIKSAEVLNKAYFGIVFGGYDALLQNIRKAFQVYGPFLNLPNNSSAVAEKIEQHFKNLGGVADQYDFDLLKDLATAYNEAVTAACPLLTICCPVRDFPRHLMLGMKSGGPDDAYRHRFAASPVRNVMHGELERVRKLFQRITAMVDNFDFTEPALAISPSHTELHPLGQRALPFYFPFAALKDLWQPRLGCTGDLLWSCQSKEGESSLQHVYAQASFLRIEGHLNQDCSTAESELKNLRLQLNAEFNLICAYLQDPDPDEADRQKEISKSEKDRVEWIQKLRDAVNHVLSKSEPLVGQKEIQETFSGILENERKLIDDGRIWRQARLMRRLYCDLRHLEADYLELTAGLRCILNELLGQLAKLSILAREMQPGAHDARTRQALLLEQQIPELLAERLVAAIAAFTESPDSLKDFLSNIDDLWARAQKEPELLAALLLRVTGEAASRSVLAFLDTCIPRHLCELDYQLLLPRYKRITGDLLRLFLVCEVVEFIVCESGDGNSSRSHICQLLEWRHVIASILRAVASCVPARMAPLAFQYEQARKLDLSLFKNLAEHVNGMEHAAGVEKGGTFILACDRDPQSKRWKVMGDFSLANRVPCCCNYDAAAVDLPLVALPDYRVVTLRPQQDGKNYEPVSAEIDLLANDYDPNFEFEESGFSGKAELVISALQEKTDFGGTVDRLTDTGVVMYRHAQARPGMLDRFTYTVGYKENKDPSDSTEVLILFLPEIRVQKAAVRGDVRNEETGRAAVGAVVHILETGDEKVTNADGKYEFTELLPGSYTFQATLGTRASERTPRNLEAGQTATVNLTIIAASKTGIIRVRVTSARQLPIGGATVTLLVGRERVASTNTGPEGSAELSALNAGSYQLAVGKEGYWPETADAPLEAGKTLTKDFSLTQQVYYIPPDLNKWVAERKHLTLADAEQRTNELYFDRFAQRYAVARKVGDDPRVNSSPAFDASEAFLRTLSTPNIPEKHVLDSYLEVTSMLGAAIKQSGAPQVEEFSQLLSAVTLALLDRVVMTNPENLGAEAKGTLGQAASRLKDIGLKVAPFAEAWRGESFVDKLGLTSPGAIGEAFR